MKDDISTGQRPTVEGGIKYRFGLDQGGQLVDIKAPGVLRGQDYTCLACNQVLRPVLGEVRQKHFRHRHDAECSPETYLHNLAKLTFYNTYRACLDAGAPYWFEYPVQRQCTYCEYGLCDVPGEVRRTDLTRLFPEVFLEQRDGEFIPDVLLQGTHNKLYVEMVVTHYAEEKKQASGVRIVEVKFETEDDIDILLSRVLSLRDQRVHGYNLRTAPVTGDFKEMCQRTATFFHLDVCGAARLAVVTLSVLPDLRAKGGYVERVPARLPEVFLAKLRYVLNEGKDVHHCWLCIHHCMSGCSSSCGRLNQRVYEYWPTTAANCEFYERWSYNLIPDVLNWVLENLRGEKARDESSEREPIAPHPVDWTGKCEFCGKFTSDWWTFNSRTGKCKCNYCLHEGKS